MFEAHSPAILPRARHRALLCLLIPLTLAPLASCAEDRYLAQNYQTNNPGYAPPSYSSPPPAYVPANVEGGQYLAPPQLADLVARIALYPDDLIGIILPASTYPLQVVQAARYLDAVRSNSTLAPDDSWDNAVVALLNYPDVVNMMNRDLEWTERLGQAVIAQQPDVIAAIGQFRAQAQAAGNLRSDTRQLVVQEQGAIRIRPANPQIIYVPQYEPAQVIVYQSQPAFAYFPRPCPVYYYNYASGYPSGFTNFWGVSTLFTIGWSSRSVHLHDYDYYDDPRFDRPYNGYFYRRSHHGWRDDDDRRWHDDDGYRGRDGRDQYGPRPPRERDWQPRGGGRPRPIGIGGNGGRDRDDDGRGNAGIPGDRDPGRDEPRLYGPRKDGKFNQPSPPRRVDIDNDGGHGGGRRNSAPDAPRQPPGQGFQPPRDEARQPRRVIAPDAPGAVAPRRIEVERAPRVREQQPPARFSAPVAPRMQQNDAVRRASPPLQNGPVRNLRSLDEGRSNARQMGPTRAEQRNFAPNREVRAAPPPERRMAPSRQENRAAPSRGEMRGPPADFRRGGDDERGRGNRER